MKYLIEDYIHPIMDGSDCVGQGFEADGYFVTAAHVRRMQKKKKRGPRL